LESDEQIQSILFVCNVTIFFLLP